MADHQDNLSDLRRKPTPVANDELYLVDSIGEPPWLRPTASRTTTEQLLTSPVAVSAISAVLTTTANTDVIDARIDSSVNYDVIDARIDSTVNYDVIDARIAGSNTRLDAIESAANPVGSLIPFAGTTSPDTNFWLLCDGASYDTTVYATLHAVIGYTFGGAGASFNVPDMRGRVPAGIDSLGGVSADILTAINADSLGGTLGTETHTLLEAELPQHSHDINHDHPSTASSAGSSHTHTMPSHSHTGGTYSVNIDHDHPNTSVVFGQTIKSVSGYASGPDLDAWAIYGGTQLTATVNIPNYNVANRALAGSSQSVDPGDTNAEAAHTHNVDLGPLGVTASGTTGTDTAHNNTQPTLAVGYLIRAQ